MNMVLSLDHFSTRIVITVNYYNQNGTYHINYIYKDLL